MTTNEIDFEWLEARVFCRDLTDQEKDSLREMIVVDHFGKGQKIIVANEPGGNLYLLRSGRVDVLLNFNGESIKAADLGEGAQVGDMSFIDDDTASATIVARGNCVAYKITRDALSRLFVFRPSVAKDMMFGMMRQMSRNIRALNESNAAKQQYIQGRRV